jgi:hypothetical protein
VSNKPAVVLTLAGDEKRLTESFDRVGAASKAMASQVDASSKAMSDSGSRFDAMTEKSDTAESRFTGFYDTLGGTTDALAAWNDESLSSTEKMIALGQAGADLAGGFTNFVIPAMASAASMMSGPLRMAMTFISSHPLLIVLGLITIAVIYLVTQTDWFQAVATKVFNWVGNLVKNVFGASIDWIVNRWNDVVGFFQRLPENIGKALSGLGGFFEKAFKGGMNIVIGILNWGIDRVNDIIDGINIVSPWEDIRHVPHIARMHTGGVYRAPNGNEGLALLKDGEQVSAPGQGGGGTLRVVGTGALAELIQAMITDGSIQLEGR